MRVRKTSPALLWSLLQYPQQRRADPYGDYDDGYGTSGGGGGQRGDHQQGGQGPGDDYQQGGYEQGGDYPQAGYDQGSGHAQDGYDQGSGYPQQGYDQGGSYDQESYPPDSGYAGGGYEQSPPPAGTSEDGGDPYGDPYYDSDRFGGGRDPYYDGREYGKGIGPYSPQGTAFKAPKKRPPYALVFGLVLLIVLPLLLVIFIAPQLVSLHDTRTIEGLQKFRYKFQSTTGAVAKVVTVEIVGGAQVDITLCREADDSGDACANPVARSESVSTFKSSRTLANDHYVLIIDNLSEDDVIAKFAVHREMF